MQQLQTGKQECVNYFISCSYNADCVGSYLYTKCKQSMTFILNNHLMYFPFNPHLILQYTLLIKEKYIEIKSIFYYKYSSEVLTMILNNVLSDVYFIIVCTLACRLSQTLVSKQRQLSGHIAASGDRVMKLIYYNFKNMYSNWKISLPCSTKVLK